jgi:hypothetical protein
MLLLSVCRYETIRQVVITKVMFYIVSLSILYSHWYGTRRRSMIMKQMSRERKVLHEKRLNFML